jgi:hypothetical protein
MGKKDTVRMCRGCGCTVTMCSPFSMRNHLRKCAGDEGDSDEELINQLNEDVQMVEMEEDERPLVNQDVRMEGVVKGLKDFEHLTQFLETGRCVVSDAEMQLVKFMHMSHGGYGVSRAFSVGMLQFCKEAGGKNMHLPDSWNKCVEFSTELIERLEGKRKTFTLDVPIPANVREMLADPGQSHIAFEFECPVTEMIRIAMFSKTCQSWDNVALSYEDNDGHLDDFCNGDRYKRIASTLSPGGAILGCVLATDGICLDKCMFDSQEVR